MQKKFDFYDDINEQNVMSNLDLSYDNTARNQQAQNNLLDWKTSFPLFPRFSGIGLYLSTCNSRVKSLISSGFNEMKGRIY
jgi:hypothetical protein